MTDPPVFKRLGLLYFAAASFSEAARRLGRPELAPGFLLHQHPRFGPELRACAAEAVEVAAMASSDVATVAPSSAPCAAASGALREALLARIDRAIEPFDIAGLRDRTRRDWYPALAEDLIAGAAKLEASAEDIDRLLARSGFTPRASAEQRQRLTAGASITTD